MYEHLIKLVDFCKENTLFTETKMRSLISRSGDNGLGQYNAIFKIGKDIYIDKEQFKAFVESQSLKVIHKKKHKNRDLKKFADEMVKLADNFNDEEYNP